MHVIRSRQIGCASALLRFFPVRCCGYLMIFHSFCSQNRFVTCKYWNSYRTQRFINQRLSKKWIHIFECRCVYNTVAFWNIEQVCNGSSCSRIDLHSFWFGMFPLTKSKVHSISVSILLSDITFQIKLVIHRNNRINFS